MALTADDMQDLIRARRILERPGFVAKLMSRFGSVIEEPFRMLPEKWSGHITRYTEIALEHAMKTAILSLDDRFKGKSRDAAHMALSVATGAVGGFFGLKALALELPLSTAVMLRSIADIARSEGERLDSFETRLACLEVFALGGGKSSDDASETGYYVIRSALGKAVSDAARYMAEVGLIDEGAPVLVRFISQVASRFSVAVSEKLTAQLVPIIGAVGGASINLLFTDHFQSMARGHFTVRRLERKYGQDVIRAEYERIKPWQ